MSTTRAKTPLNLEVISADGSQVDNAFVATLTDAGQLNVTIGGDLTVEGNTTYLETTNLKITDALIELNKNNSGGADEDAGMLINRGSAGNNAVFYWNEGDDKFKAALTTSTAESDSVTDTSLATIQADGFETDALRIIDNDIVGLNSNANINITASGTGDVVINGLLNVGTETFNVGQISIEGNEIFSTFSNADIKISASSSGQIHFDDFTKFTAQGSDPTAVTDTTHLYAKTQSGGGTGLFYVNTSSSGELVSKAKAQIFGLIF
tara:strand:- start:124 stop:921 length:798 start_codon:yes stop_codon:yes gene_type:complete